MSMHAFPIAANGDVVGDSGTAAIDINSSGLIVGTVAYQPPNSSQHSFVRTPDGTYTLFDPPDIGSDSSHPVRMCSLR